MALHSAALLLLCSATSLSRAAPLLPDKTPPKTSLDAGPRGEKALEYFQYLLPPFVGDGDFYDQARAQQEARNEPLLGAKEPLFPDSPIYYIRLPPSPYAYVPGLGYVSQPQPQQQQQSAVNPFLSLPLNFLANGKPSSIYQWSSPGGYQLPTTTTTTTTPPPVAENAEHSAVVNLDKGPYVFNGRPSDIFVLRDSYNSLYSDALQNFYP
ncbi:hypothetical protein PR048_002897 [Dryococelus australis]|uniref:Uncharacterized protein n=1 Tax=Dryococelus australis TaxID=614101 RepID=A0ABQ9INS4_9NEOP|nr:hypothetical protein PR048_002897 [Dryococelus australis]